MLFEYICDTFWQRYVFPECDWRGLLALVQTNRYMHARRKYIYRLCFWELLRRMKRINIYYNITPDHISFAYANSLDLLIRNKTFQSWFIQYEFKLEAEPVIIVVQEIFKKHCLIKSDEYTPMFKKDILDLIYKTLNYMLSNIKNPKQLFKNGDYHYIFQGENHIIKHRKY